MSQVQEDSIVPKHDYKPTSTVTLAFGCTFPDDFETCKFPGGFIPFEFTLDEYDAMSAIKMQHRILTKQFDGRDRERNLLAAIDALVEEVTKSYDPVNAERFTSAALNLTQALSILRGR